MTMSFTFWNKSSDTSTLILEIKGCCRHRLFRKLLHIYRHRKIARQKFVLTHIRFLKIFPNENKFFKPFLHKHHTIRTRITGEVRTNYVKFDEIDATQSTGFSTFVRDAQNYGNESRRQTLLQRTTLISHIHQYRRMQTCASVIRRLSHAFTREFTHRVQHCIL